MKCPNCNETLLMSQRNNIEIDYCPSCRGVWLDKGELDKMLEYATQQQQQQQQSIQNPGPQSYPANTGGGYNQYDKHQYDKHQYDKHHYGHKKPYKKKSFLGDLFDFD